MRGVSRREFFTKVAIDATVAGSLSAGARELRAAPLGLPIGSQTWPDRQRIKDGDFAGLCKDMADIGVRNLELCSPTFAEFTRLSDARQTRKIIEGHGLKCPSGLFQMVDYRTKQEEMIAWAKDIGITQMGTASLGGRVENGAVTMDAVKRASDEYNKFGEVAAKAGIQQFLHDENFEMSKVDGRLTYEVLLELLDPKLVKMQFQMSAMRTVGDPVMYFNKYPGRFISMHLQGVDLNAPKPTVLRESPRLALGGPRDTVDWAKVFAAAKIGGLKNYFVELNWQSTVESVKYLKTLTV